MTDAVYNEIDTYPAAWLRNLVACGHVAPGIVDERSIADLGPDDVRGPGQRHFFAGIGGWSYALRLARVPDDADVWTASCPCQPFSAAGRRGRADDLRHLWPALYRLVAECRPAILFGEQVASGDGRQWLTAVRADMEAIGYAVGAADLAAASVGAPHIRQRLYFVARRMGDADGEHAGRVSNRARRTQGESEGPRGVDRYVGYQPRAPSRTRDAWSDAEWIACTDGKSRPAQPGAFPLADGVPYRVGKLRAYGNAIVPQVAAAFIRATLDALEEI